MCRCDMIVCDYEIDCYKDFCELHNHDRDFTSDDFEIAYIGKWYDINDFIHDYIKISRDFIKYLDIDRLMSDNNVVCVRRFVFAMDV